jgi:hypothetical protein
MTNINRKATMFVFPNFLLSGTVVTPGIQGLHRKSATAEIKGLIEHIVRNAAWHIPTCGVKRQLGGNIGDMPARYSLMKEGRTMNNHERQPEKLSHRRGEQASSSSRKARSLTPRCLAGNGMISLPTAITLVFRK